MCVTTIRGDKNSAGDDHGSGDERPSPPCSYGVPEQMLAAYEAARRSLPPAGELTTGRRRRRAWRAAAGVIVEQLREAVRRTAATPFLAGAGPRGWRADFDWLIANDENIRKVLQGRYDLPHAASRTFGTANGSVRGGKEGQLIAELQREQVLHWRSAARG